MEIKLSDIPIRKGRKSATVNIELEEEMLSLDFRRKDGALGAYVEFRMVGNLLHIAVEAASPDSELRLFKVDLSGERKARP
ncbi:MAG: hypothetical protein ACREAM_07355 [Blastocatellia bacterium]